MQTSNTKPMGQIPEKLPHNLILEERARLTVSGVTRIVRYDEDEVVLETGKDTLTIGGGSLQVSELSIQSGEVRIAGHVEYVQYSEPIAHSAGGLLRRLAR